METLIIIIIVFAAFSLLFIYDRVSKDKNKDRNKVEKYGKAMGEYAHSLADGVAGAAFLLTESKEHKKKRLAEDIISRYNSRYLYKYTMYDNKPKDPLKDYNDNEELRNAIQEVGISKDEWLKRCNELIELSHIVVYKNDKNYQNTPYINQMWLNEDDNLRKSLAFCNVPEEDWIKYGTNVLVMYDLYVKVENNDD